MNLIKRFRPFLHGADAGCALAKLLFKLKNKTGLYYKEIGHMLYET